MGNLVLPKNNFEEDKMKLLLEFFFKKDSWVTNESIISEYGKLLVSRGWEEKEKEPQSYTKKIQVFVYYGFIEWKDPLDKSSKKQITESGKLLYESWIENPNEDNVRRVVIDALKKCIFGRNVAGISSDSDIEAPNVAIRACFFINKLSNKEFAYLVGMLDDNKADFSELLMNILNFRKDNSLVLEEKYNKYSDTKILIALKFWKILDKDFDSKNYIIDKKTLREYERDIYQLRIFNTYPRSGGILPKLIVNQSTNKLYTVEYLKYFKYLAAIKSKPFLLLAGISGTGKSRIVRQLARACDKFDYEPWEVQKPYNYEMISVKPNWHDSTELFGYISRVSGKPHYIVTDFLKFIAKAWMYEDIPFFLCLDEMNLAPVEQYFAEFLSVMESRKLNNETNVIASDPLLYLSSSSEEEEEMTTNMINDMFSKFEYHENLFENVGDYNERLESLKEQFKKEGISIPRNLIVIGTVNMDETTYTFSRKVLDRAMTIEMNEVILTDGLNKDKDILPDIAPEWILPDTVEGYDFYDKNTEVCDYVIEYLEKINEKLEGTPFKIAYRTRNDCMLYVVNSLILYGKSDGLTEDNIRDRALDEVTSMKILSRIEGDKKKVGETLSELERVIKEQFNLTDSDEDRTKSVSLKKLKEMNDRLTNTYYCSFWS